MNRSYQALGEQTIGMKIFYTCLVCPVLAYVIGALVSSNVDYIAALIYPSFFIMGMTGLPAAVFSLLITLIMSFPAAVKSSLASSIFIIATIKFIRLIIAIKYATIIYFIVFLSSFIGLKVLITYFSIRLGHIELIIAGEKVVTVVSCSLLYYVFLHTSLYLLDR